MADPAVPHCETWEEYEALSDQERLVLFRAKTRYDLDDVPRDVLDRLMQRVGARVA